MKKLLLVLSIVLSLALVSSLAACNRNNAATVESSSPSLTASDNSAEGSAGGSQGGQQGPQEDPHAAYKVTAEQFATALSPDSFLNATITRDAHCIIGIAPYTFDTETSFVAKIDAESGVHYASKGMIASSEYVAIKADGEFYFFDKDYVSGKFLVSTIDEAEFINQIENIFYVESLADFGDIYSSLAFDEETDSYVATNIQITPENALEPTLFDEISFKFVDGDLLSLSYVKDSSNTPATCTYTVSDRNATVITAPAESDRVNACTVEFDSNGDVYGYVGLSSMKVAEGASYVIVGNVLKYGQMEITAEANENYVFEKWTINGETAEDEGTFDGDCSVIAVFKPDGDYYTVKFESSNEDYGSVDPAEIYVFVGARYSVDGETISSGDLLVFANAETGYVFDKWTVNGETVEGEGTFDGDCTLVAVFKKFEPDPDSYYLIWITEDGIPEITDDYSRLYKDDETGSHTKEAYLSEGEVIRITSGVGGTEGLIDWDEDDPDTAAAADLADGNAVIKADGAYTVSVVNGVGRISPAPETDELDYE